MRDSMLTVPVRYTAHAAGLDRAGRNCSRGAGSARSFAAKRPTPQAHLYSRKASLSRPNVNPNQCLKNPAIPGCFLVSWTPKKGMVLGWYRDGAIETPLQCPDVRHNHAHPFHCQVVLYLLRCHSSALNLSRRPILLRPGTGSQRLPLIGLNLRIPGAVGHRFQFLLDSVPG